MWEGSEESTNEPVIGHGILCPPCYRRVQQINQENNPVLTYPRYSILMILVLASFCGLIPAADLPAAAQKVMDKATTDIAKVRMELVRDLTKAQEAATKKGDLDGAMAIKAEIEKQNKELESAGDLLGNPPPKKTWAVGSWDVTWGGFRSTITFEKDSTVSRSDGVKGKATFSDAGLVTITWDADMKSGGTTWTIAAPEKGNSEAAKGKNAYGTPFTATKQ